MRRNSDEWDDVISCYSCYIYDWKGICSIEWRATRTNPNYGLDFQTIKSFEIDLNELNFTFQTFMYYFE